MGSPVRAEILRISAGPRCHDAIQAIFSTVGPNAERRWVLDADLAAAFDRIDHHHLASMGFPARGRSRWLKAGVVDQGRFTPTEEGTPQGGIISPALMNVALHGMEGRLPESATSPTASSTPGACGLEHRWFESSRRSFYQRKRSPHDRHYKIIRRLPGEITFTPVGLGAPVGTLQGIGRFFSRSFCGRGAGRIST